MISFDLRKILAVAGLLVFFSVGASAQKWAAGVNVGELAWFGTLNTEASFAAGRHITLNTRLRYNPWSWREEQGPDRQINQKQRTFNLGAKFWPWYTYSGWWFGAAAQYQEYNRGGLFGATESSRLHTEEGDAFGGVLSAGFALMLGKHLNLDMGVAGWGGIARYVSYDCPRCGRRDPREGVETKGFVLPDAVLVNLIWVF